MDITYYCPQNLFSLKISLPSCIQQCERRLTAQVCGLNPGWGAVSPDSSAGPEAQSHRAAVQDEMIQFSSVAQSCPTLFNPMNHSTPGLPVHHQLPEFTQTHIHRVCDAIQPSHPGSSPSPPAPNPSQHQSLFQ